MTQSILVIDDDPAIRKSFSLTLSDHGFHVDLAESGIIGLNKLQAGSYYLILLDLKMPEMDGIQTLRKIRKLNPDIPVYIITAFHEEFLFQLNQLDQENIAYELLKKPIGQNKLVLLAKSVIHGPQLNDEHER